MLSYCFISFSCLLDCCVKDLTYQPGATPSKKEEDRKQQRRQRKRDRLFSTGSIRDSPSGLSVVNGVGSQTTGVMAALGNGGFRNQRTHRLSMSSNGSSSPPSSAGTTPCTPNGHFMPQSKKNKFDFFADLEQAASGNIFRHRTDLAAFGTLPRHLQVTMLRFITSIQFQVDVSDIQSSCMSGLLSDMILFYIRLKLDTQRVTHAFQLFKDSYLWKIWLFLCRFYVNFQTSNLEHARQAVATFQSLSFSVCLVPVMSKLWTTQVLTHEFVSVWKVAPSMAPMICYFVAQFFISTT